MEMLESVFVTLSKAFTFKGTSTRSEFWYFQLFVFITTLLLLFLDSPALLMTFGLMSLVPLYSVQFRRLHDVGKSGWWLLMYFIPFGFIYLGYLACLKSKVDDNPFIVV